MQTQKILAAMAALAMMGMMPAANAVTITTTSGLLLDGRENAGAVKQVGTPLPNLNSNYITGFNNDGIARSFFSFDISLIGSGQVVTTLSLELRRFNSNVGNTDPTETLEFWDVSTDPSTLNNNAALNAGIFADLGGGTSYGQFVVPGTGLTGDILTFALDADAINDINARLAAYQSNPITANQFFSIGGDMITNDGNDGIFGASNLSNGASLPRPTLQITTREVIAQAPEPATLAALGFGLLGVAAIRRRRVGR